MPAYTEGYTGEAVALQLLVVIFLGIAANLDNLGIGLAYGVQKTRIPIVSNLVIAAISMAVTGLSMLAGDRIAAFITPDAADWIGGLLLCGIGVWMLCQPKFGQVEAYEDAKTADTDGNRVISVREAIPLGFVLAANCLAAGFGMGVSGSSMIGTILSVGFFSFITIGGSHRFGTLLARTWIGRYPAAFAGGLLIVIGVLEIAL
ncbi:manganese efflux pump [Sporosarcina koreensis]|uniref:manganese efflux pump n=1 Tax=Sporosarcina koreensis TaxID=334735 RepID=UPI000693968D|nr:manganese efflux pump [Sporosarcina koreensis]